MHIKQEIYTSFFSLRAIQDITGFGFRTIKQRLGNLPPERRDGTSHLYDTKKALPLLYTEKKLEHGTLDLSQERAKLAAAQSEKTRLEAEKLKGSLVDKEEFFLKLSPIFVALRAKALALPSKVAPSLVGLACEDILYILQDEIHALLVGISNLGDDNDAAETIHEPASTSTEVDPEPVGG